MLDCSGFYSYLNALKIGRALDELEYEWFEEPIPDKDIEHLKKLTANLKTPVLAAETASLFDLPQYVNNGAVDILRGDTHLKGGITGMIKTLGFCEIHGYELEIHTAASPILDLANLQIGCTTHLSKFLEAHHPMFRFGLIGDPLDVKEDGCQHLPSGPGLGANIDWDWMDNHTIDKLKGCTY
jgi:L-alanine-DL-glutamate epimerase-like enolase superfamily enzyme